jgi:hypothetical protein
MRLLFMGCSPAKCLDAPRSEQISQYDNFRELECINNDVERRCQNM